MNASNRSQDGNDPFGLRSLDIEHLRRKEGAKWQSRQAKFAAWVADMDFPIAPVITDAMRAVIDAGALGYPDWGGPYALSPAAKLFGPRMAEHYGWEVRPDRVHDMIDVLQGVRATVLHRSEPGDGLVLHMPAYHPFLDTISRMDRRLVPVVRRDGAFDYETLETELAEFGASIWILCNPHNPLGYVFDRPELERIAEIAARFDITVISDEIHADLTMPGYQHVPFESLGPEVSARTVTMASASKAFNLAGLRWAVMHVGNDRMQAALAGLPGHYLGAPNLLAVTATVAAWTHGDEWLAAVIEVIDENRQALTGLLEQHLPGVMYEPPQATYLTWLDCTALGLGPDPSAVFRERGVALSAGPEFGPQGTGHVRLNIATSPSVLAAMIETMAG
jgi:cystathionine beta-lyase